MNGSIVPANQKFSDLRALLEKAAPQLGEVAPKHLNPERLARLLLAAVGRTPAILNCTQASILQFAMKCSETGLEPIGAGGAWPVPYGTVLTFIPDYRGLVNCARRAGVIRDAFAQIVYENDEFDYELGLEPKLFHKPCRKERGGLDAAYCVITMKDGIKRFVVMEGQDIIAIKNRSKAGGGPWKTDEAEMWKKTVVRRAMKPFAGSSRALDAAIEADDEATGPADIHPVDREPIPMPEAIEEPEAGKPYDGPITKEEATPEPIAEAKTLQEGMADQLPDAEPAKSPIMAWAESLAKSPDIDTLNGWLPEIAELETKDKAAVKKMITAYAIKMQWSVVKPNKFFTPD